MDLSRQIQHHGTHGTPAHVMEAAVVSSLMHHCRGLGDAPDLDRPNSDRAAPQRD